MNVSPRSLLLLLLVSALAGLLQFGGFTHRAQSQRSESVIQPEVLEGMPKWPWSSPSPHPPRRWLRSA